MREKLNCAMDIAEAMLKSGAEIHRVEDTVNRIMSAFGALRTDAFIITSSMIVSTTSPTGEVYTETRRIISSGTDFERLHRLNSLSREICKREMTVDEIRKEIEAIIRDTPVYPLWLEFLCYALIASAFTFFFGGSFIQSVVSFFIGAMIRVVVLVSDMTVNNRVFARFVSSLVATALAYLSLYLGIASGVDEIIIGNIMVLIPGVGLTNALRDLFTGDSVSGILRSIEAVLIALAIAAGYFAFVLVIGGAV